mgnify:CR=1 FL=1
MRLPRKKKKQIPNGPYCYSPVEFPNEKNNWVYRTKTCPFWKFQNGQEYCSFLKSELSIQDQVKDCGINDNY